MSLYETIGVAEDASQEEIKKAYRMRAIEHHPDAGGDPETFKAVQQAGEILCDPELRARYDETGAKDPVIDECRQMALQTIAKYFVTSDDFVTLAIDEIREGLRQMKGELRKAKSVLRGMKLRRDQYVSKAADQGVDVTSVVPILDGTIRQQDQNVGMVESKMLLAEQAIEFIQGVVLASGDLGSVYEEYIERSIKRVMYQDQGRTNQWMQCDE